MRAILNNDLYAYVIKLLARREYSIRELYGRARAKGYTEQEISEVIHKLLEFDFQSDYRYAEMLIESKYKRCYGPNYIKYYLKEKGISSNYFEKIVMQNNYDWVAAAVRIVKKRLNQVHGIENFEKQKQINFLQNRGFSIDEAREAISQVLNQ